MLKILIGIIILIILIFIILYIRNYLKRNDLKLNVKYIIEIIIIAHLIYSFIGIVISPYYTKDNGNICKGFNYGINICSGDIDAK